MHCRAYCIADSFKIDDLVKKLIQQGFEPKYFDDVIHIVKDMKTYSSDIFYFNFGCIVVFESTEHDMRKFISDSIVLHSNTRAVGDYTHTDSISYRVGSVMLSRKNLNLLEEEYENISDIENYDYKNKHRIDIENNEVVVNEDSVFTKLSIAYAMAQSVKLSSLEASCNELIKKTTPIQQELATSGSVSLSRKNIIKRMGALFTERYLVNLHSEVLDTPEFFWRRPKYENLYLLIADFQELDTRQKILNKKLDIIQELYSILSNELNHMSSSRLEIIVIVLIAMEVLIGISHTSFFNSLFC